MRLGLFGGTFDPIHLGHLILAEQCREACRLDRVWFVVAGAPPHKRGERTPVAHRIEMAKIAIAGHPAFEVSDIEAGAPARTTASIPWRPCTASGPATISSS